jgi:uncharacterized repeat protein (TIGR02543 family)
MLKLVSVFALLLTIGVGNVWGTPTTIYSEGFGSTNASNATWETWSATASNLDDSNSSSVISISGTWKVGNGNARSVNNLWAQSSGDYVIFSLGEISAIASHSDCSFSFYIRNGNGTSYDRDYAVYTSTDGGTNWSSYSLDTYKAQDWRQITISVPNANKSTFSIKVALTGNHQTRIDDVLLTGTAAACGSATPSATGTASLNGSFNMTSTTSAIGVASGTWNPGSNCSWSDYGFVWSDGTTTTTPTVSNNKVQVGTSGTGTSWTGSVTPSGSTTPTSWTTGHTYYVRAYGKNNNGSATYAYGSSWSFTPRSVTFKANGGTGSDKVQYVQGGVSTNLTANTFTRTGYTFNGWNTNSDGTSGTGYTEGQSVNLGADLILFAKWTAKTTTISFNQNSGTGGQTGTLTATYGSAMPSAPVTCPTRDGYDFGGYYDGSGGSGTQYYTNTGVSARNWDKENATWTLYAKWTVKSYSVTWKVNNTNYSAGGSTSVNHGSQVSTLPTAPDPNDYCGDKFMGWTTDAVYTHGTSPLFTVAGSAPVADGPQIFYAVFADYAE